MTDYLVYVVLSKEDPYWKAEVSLQDPLADGDPSKKWDGAARSYDQNKAIAYALEDLALKILKAVGR